MQNHLLPKSRSNPPKDCLLRYWILLQESAMVILHLRIAGICSAAISHHRFDEPEFPYRKRGNLKSASIWVNYNNPPTWIELTLVLPPIQSTWGEVTRDQFTQVLALICLDQVLCTVDIASQDPLCLSGNVETINNANDWFTNSYMFPHCLFRFKEDFCFRQE